jgi:hypothetical protein
MPALHLHIRDERTAFSPRETVIGDASWQLDTPPEGAELRLVWSTSGRGNTDMGIVETIPFSNLQASETRSFNITLPDGPYSFSGSLISLTWALELVIEPGNLKEGTVLTLAPEGRVVSLPRITERQ